MAGLVPAISIRNARTCHPKRDARVKPAHDSNYSCGLLKVRAAIGKARTAAAPPIAGERPQTNIHVEETKVRFELGCRGDEQQAAGLASRRRMRHAAAGEMIVARMQSQRIERDIA